MTQEYEIHPVAEYYGFPMIEGDDWDQFVASIKAHGQMEPVTLFEGKIADGRNRYKGCKQLGIPVVIEKYQGKDIYEYVWAKNFTRRHLNESQKALAAAKRANVRRGDVGRGRVPQDRSACQADLSVNSSKQESESQKALAAAKLANLGHGGGYVTPVTAEQAAKDAGVSKDAVARAKRTLQRGNEDIAKAIEQGKLSVWMSEQILKLPKEQQAEALAEAVKKGYGKGKYFKKAAAKTAPKAKIDWTEAERAKEAKCLEALNAPSTYPKGAPLPQGDHPDDKTVRAAIEWLRSEEPKIADYNSAQLYQMRLRTNRVQAHKVNWHKFPRPDGDIDQRWVDWAGDLWRRQHRQEERLDIRAAVRARKKAATPATPKPKATFEQRWVKFERTLEDQFGALFKPEDSSRLKKAFKKFVDEFWLDSPASQRGTTETAAALDVENGGLIDAKGITPK